MPRQLVSTDTPGERLTGFSRAVRAGNLVFVSGTTATDAAGASQHPGDAAAQSSYVLGKIQAALAEAGGSLADVVRTRAFLRDLTDAEAVARVRASFFAEIRPANTLLHGKPVDPQMVVEIEADAVIGAGDDLPWTHASGSCLSSAAQHDNRGAVLVIVEDGISRADQRLQDSPRDCLLGTARAVPRTTAPAPGATAS